MKRFKKPYWYISWKRRRILHRALMRKLDALTDPTLLDRMIAGER